MKRMLRFPRALALVPRWAGLWAICFALPLLHAVPSVTISAPTGGATFQTGTPVALSANATATTGQTVTSVTFFANGAQIGVPVTSAPFSLSWTTPTSTGSVALTAQVVDTSASNNIATSPVVNVTIAGVAPSIALTSPLNGATASLGSSVALSASASGNAGAAINKVEFLVNSSVVATSFTAPHNGSWTPTGGGNFSVVARATDANGLTATSAIANVTILAPTVALTAPLVGTTVATNTPTILTATATAPTGATVAKVDFFAGSTLLGTATSEPFTFSWSPISAAANLALTARVTDSNGAVATSAVVNVTVAADPNAPTVSLAISPGGVTVPVSSIRHLLATAQASAGRAIQRVEFFVAGVKVGERTSAPYFFRYSASTVGSYVFTARATDNAGVSREAELTLAVVAQVGAAPTVNLIAPTSGSTIVPNVATNLSAAADASGGSVAGVQFYANGLPQGATDTAAPFAATFTPTSTGSYVLDAIVVDDRGNSRVSNVSIVSAAFPSPTLTLTAPAAGARATPNVPVNISAAVQGGGGAAVVLVEFLVDGIAVGSRTAPASGSTYTFSWTPSTANLGARAVSVRATDANGQSATSAAVTVNVANVVGSPPTVTIAAPTATQATTLQALSTVNFVANAFASGAANSLTSVEFFLNDTSIGTGTREQTTNLYRLAYNLGEFNFAALAPDVNGRYPVVLTAIARDANGNQTVSPALSLAINPSTSAAPSVQLVAQGAPNVTQGTPFLMTATPLDFDGAVTSLQLFVNGAAAGNAIPNPAAQATLSYTATAAGRFNLYVVATDDTGNTAVSSPSIVLNVTAVTVPATQMVRPADNSTVTTVGAPVFLEATASSPDTNTLTVTFVATAASGARTVVNAAQVPNTTTYRAVWTPATAGTYTVTSAALVPGTTVSASSANSRRVVANAPVGNAPTITLNAPANNATVTTASTVNFTATATDFDGSVEGVEFFVGRNSVGQGVRDQLTNTWRLTVSMANVPAGTTDVVALARDSSGNVADPTGTTNINVVAATSIAPIVSISASTNNAAFSRQVQLTASARDTDGNVTNVQYFSNGANIGNSGNAGTSYLVNWTPNQSGTFNVWAVATDNSGNTTVAATLLVTVRPNNPVLDDDAFILQTYTDIANAGVPNALVFANLSAQFAAGTLTRGQFVANLTAEAGFAPPTNLLAAYYALMGQWPTPANYQTLLGTARTSLPNAVGAILSSPEYVAKFGPTPTAATFNTSYPVFSAFATRLWQNAGLGGPTTLQVFQFQNNDAALPTLGRGYAAAGVGLNTAIAEFVTNTNSTNAAFLKRARAAALYYQLNRPPVTVTTDEIATRVSDLALLPDVAAIASAVLQDQLYLYRYVTILTQPQSQTVAAGATATFSVTAVGAPPLGYQWFFNGGLIAGATSRTLSVTGVNAAKVGAYTVVVSSVAGSATSQVAMLGLATTVRVTGASLEVARDLAHENRNIYDQLLLRDDAVTFTADPGQITRLSFVDLTNDIVQVEFSGAGALSLTLENVSGPLVAANYNQPDVAYMRGHASIVITGADETTNLTVFSVGRLTAVNESLFRTDVRYDGVADLAYVAILSADGKFGGLRTANASYFATRGYTGVFAPGVQFTGPVYIGDISAAEEATPVLFIGAAADVRITGGDLFQANGRAIQASGTGSVKFTDGMTSHGGTLPAQASQGVFEETGVEVSTQAASP